MSMKIPTNHVPQQPAAAQQVRPSGGQRQRAASSQNTRFEQVLSHAAKQVQPLFQNSEASQVLTPAEKMFFARNYAVKSIHFHF